MSKGPLIHKRIFTSRMLNGWGSHYRTWRRQNKMKRENSPHRIGFAQPYFDFLTHRCERLTGPESEAWHTRYITCIVSGINTRVWFSYSHLIQGNIKQTLVGTQAVIPSCKSMKANQVALAFHCEPLRWIGLQTCIRDGGSGDVESFSSTYVADGRTAGRVRFYLLLNCLHYNLA